MTDSVMYVGKVWGEESISNYHAYLIRGEFQNGTKPPSMNAFSCRSQSQHLYHFSRVAEEKCISPWIGLLNSVGRSSNFTCLQRGKERERELHRKIDLHLVRDLANRSFATSESSGQETSGSRFIIISFCSFPAHFNPHYLGEVKL